MPASHQTVQVASQRDGPRAVLAYVAAILFARCAVIRRSSAWGARVTLSKSSHSGAPALCRRRLAPASSGARARRGRRVSGLRRRGCGLTSSRCWSVGRARYGSDSAERGGFEPPVRLPAHMISNHAPSATRSPLQGASPVGEALRSFFAGVSDSFVRALTYRRGPNHRTTTSKTCGESGIRTHGGLLTHT